MSSNSGRKLPMLPGKYRRRRYHEPIILIPASELDSIATWRKRAELLGNNGMLMVIPHSNRQLQAVSERIRIVRSQHGRRLLITRLH